MTNGKLTVSLQISPNPANLGDQITFKAIVAGGQSPYTFVWSGRPDVNTDTIVCNSQTAGSFQVGVTVTDSLGVTANSQTQYTVNTSTALSVSIQINPNTIILGDQSTLNATVTGGNKPYSYQWSNLPTPCTTTNSNVLTCKPDTSGNYTIKITITDSSSTPAIVSTTGQLTVNKISPQTLKVNLELSHKTIKAKHKVTAKTKVSGGSKPYTYEYTGLPHPCITANKDQIDCIPDQKGTFNIVVNVKDSKGNTGTDTHSLIVS